MATAALVRNLKNLTAAEMSELSTALSRIGITFDKGCYGQHDAIADLMQLVSLFIALLPHGRVDTFRANVIAAPPPQTPSPNKDDSGPDWN